MAVITESDCKTIKDYRQRAIMVYNFINEKSIQAGTVSPRTLYKTYTEPIVNIKKR